MGDGFCSLYREIHYIEVRYIKFECTSWLVFPLPHFPISPHYSFTVDLMNSSIIISENIFVIQEYVQAKGWDYMGDDAERIFY